MKPAAERRRIRDARRRHPARNASYNSGARLIRERVYERLRERYDLPTLSEWYKQLPTWKTDGATRSPDWICGVQIGATGDLSWPPLPATLHDYLFLVGGGLGRFRMANRVFRDYLLAYVLELYDRELWTEGSVRRRVKLYAWAVGTRLAARHFSWRLLRQSPA